MEILRVNSASYAKDGDIVFDIQAILRTVTYESIEHSIPSHYPEVDKVCKEWLEDNTPAAYEVTVGDRRLERKKEFSETIDLMNPFWFGELSEEEMDEIYLWRQQWLDYPETGVKPVRPSIWR